MKWIPKIIFSLAMTCLLTIDSDAQKAHVSKQLSFPELYQAGHKSFTYKQLIRYETLKGRFRARKIEELSKIYKPKEVYIEILRRAGKMQGDTTLPPGYEKYYQLEEFKGILIKNRPLYFLSDIESIDLYKTICAPNGIKAIRGDEDNREEVVYNTSDLSNPNPQRKDMCNARCVAAAIPVEMLAREPAMFKLQNYLTFHQRKKACEEEPFNTQPAAADFTAFVVDDSTLITAGHSLDATMLMRYYFVFDYIMGPQHQDPQYFPEANVVMATKIIPYYDPANDQDVCIIRVNKKIDSRRIPQLSQQSATNNSNTYYVIGTPCGIPLKLAGKAKIMENSSPAYFLLNSDTYEGNSGSPVFNTVTNTIEGILISGANDLEPNALNISCRLSVLCLFDECPGSKGEKILRTSQFLHLIK